MNKKLNVLLISFFNYRLFINVRKSSWIPSVRGRWRVMSDSYQIKPGGVQLVTLDPESRWICLRIHQQYKRFGLEPLLRRESFDVFPDTIRYDAIGAWNMHDTISCLTKRSRRRAFRRLIRSEAEFFLSRSSAHLLLRRHFFAEGLKWFPGPFVPNHYKKYSRDREHKRRFPSGSSYKYLPIS